jgi:hypothetical protein
VLTKFDDATSSTELVKNIANDLIIILNPIIILSKTGYGIHKLKNMINACVSPQHFQRKLIVNIAPADAELVITRREAKSSLANQYKTQIMLYL